MTVDASCRLSLLFLLVPGRESKYICFGELFDSLSSIALDIFLVQFIFES